MKRIRTAAGWLVLSVVAAALLGACASDSVDAGSSGATADEGPAQVHNEEAPAAQPAARAAGYADDSGSSGPGGGSSGMGGGGDLVADTGGGSVMGAIAQVPEVRANVIKTADVTIEVPVDSVDDAVRDGIAAAGRYGGFVLSTTMDGSKRGSATVVVRVPAEYFEQAMTELEGLGKVTEEIVTGRDVGAEFVDLEARIRNLEAQETVMLRLMERSQSVSDTIKVQRELQGIQLEVERLTGRLRYLKDQADLSTISLSFYEKGAVTTAPKVGMLGRAWNRAIDLALGVVAAIIVSTGVLVPLALILLAAYLVLRLVRPRFSS